MGLIIFSCTTCRLIPITIQILSSSKRMLMERFKVLGGVVLFFVLCSCKKNTELNLDVKVQNLYVTFINSNRVDITYELSRLGYQETGVNFYKKSEPQKTNQVKAIRKDGILRLSLQDLEADTEYVFRVFHKEDDTQKTDSRDYTVKTLSTISTAFTFKVMNSMVNYDNDGNFTAELEGENLDKLDLLDLEIQVNNVPIQFDYPVLISDRTFKMTVKGTVNPINTNYVFRGFYEGREILFQSVPFQFNGERYWLSYTPTNLRTNKTSVFNNELYYFLDQKVFKWNEPEERLQAVGTGNTENDFIGYNDGIQFDGKIFFSAVEQAYWSPDDMNSQYNYPQAYSFSPVDDIWYPFPFKERKYPRTERLSCSHSFIHKGELYLAYSIINSVTNQAESPAVYVYRYNKSTKQFTQSATLTDEISDYLFVSVNNQLYLLGLVPVFDQGLKMSSTLSVHKVNDLNFELEEIYHGGTVYEPLAFVPKSAVEYDQMILTAASLHDFVLFDPLSRQLSKVYLRNPISQMYFGGLFSYNNKLHLNADLNFYSGKIYEISIKKER